MGRVGELTNALHCLDVALSETATFLAQVQEKKRPNQVLSIGAYLQELRELVGEEVPECPVVTSAARMVTCSMSPKPVIKTR